ncbi:cellobiose dehydrogenase-like protein 2 [Elsinoe australis]|uniref:Cellobiose dehydrogenase-like protein 2 n=1 Tax=Elsinoe australis TaxID=40998 RepID=A0A4U7AUE4_9PEZI|nr:cellobiose dehydrogenase-like protein 2 [Elsinoe australis]
MKPTLLASLLAASVTAQQASYTDSKTGIKFWEQDLSPQAGPNGFRFGIALPATTQTQYQDEYIGHIVLGLSNGAGWGGLAHGGSMTNNLLLTVWPNAGKVVTSLRFASGYDQPAIYNGNATVVPISQSVNSTHAEIIYRCLRCWTWSQASGASGSSIPPTTADGVQPIGWAAHTELPATPADPNSLVEQHPYFGIAVQPAASGRNTAYTKWIASATAAPPGTTAAPTTTAAPSPTSCSPKQAAPTDVYDYIIAGAGAGGIPIAAKLSEAGKKVLLIEKGPPSAGRWGGTLGPSWLSGTGLTRFDVPGLCNQIWHDSAGIACTDAPSMAGCVLGGGTAINAGLWWKATPADFDQFPPGWRSQEVNQAITRVFQKIPGTYLPSKDGKSYLRQGFNSIATALSAAGWSQVDANASPASKSRTFTQTPYMFSGGERGGPMATYLLEASKRSNFKLMMNTSVKRVVRTGAQATGVELEATNANGLCGTVKLATNGKVILSAGVFGTTKILFRSGIGPTDQLNIVKSSTDGATMIASNQWLNLPVGQNLVDHTNTDLVIRSQDSVFYDFYGAWDAPIAADKTAYLNSRSGILAQSAPNIGPIFFDVVTPSDGIARQMQWTARVEGAAGFPDNTSMVLSQYLGRGKTSRGKMTINKDLTLAIPSLPFVNTQGDIDAIVQGIKNVLAALAKNTRITVLAPAAGQTVEDFVKAQPNTIGARTANHWMGTAKMGTDSGLTGGTSVVDTSTKVYGTNNIFVVDASIFPGMVSTNPSALIVAAAERAWEYISGIN